MKTVSKVSQHMSNRKGGSSEIDLIHHQMGVPIEVKLDDIGSVIDAVRANLPSVAKLRKEKNMKMVGMYLGYLIKSSAKLTGIKNVPGDDVVYAITQRLTEEFYHLNMGDFKIAINNGMSGMYGTIYDRIGIDMVCNWVRRYTEEKQVVFQKESKKYKKQEEVKNPTLTEKIREARLKLEAKEREKRRPKAKCYKSLEDWAEKNGLDPEQTREEYEAKWTLIFEEKELGESFELDAFLKFNENQFLVNKNKNTSK